MSLSLFSTPSYGTAKSANLLIKANLLAVYTIANFGSVILVTVTVTRKMLTMMLSVVAYGHSLTEMQWLGVGLVFGGIGVEARIKHTSEMAKAKEKAAKKAA